MKVKTLLTIFTFLIAAQFVNAQVATVWGSTTYGGAYDEGTIFKMSTDGSDYTIMHSFNWPEGFVPMGNLYQASDGNLYGACEEGGDSGSCTIFQYKPATGEYTDVYNFGSLWGDFPTSGVVEKDGILYGNSSSGGTFYGGVVYSYNISTGVYTDLYNLPMGSDPINAPTFASNGVLYGTTVWGGTGSGSVYSYDPATGIFTDVHDFSGATGFNPYPSLYSAIDGKLYGMTTYGGTYGKGIIFSIDPADNTYTKLYDFDGTNGSRPKGALTQGFDGWLYGMTTMGGLNNEGVIFKFDPEATVISKLYDLSTSDGITPLGNLMATPNVIYGTTSAGGSYGFGTAFSYDLQAGTFTKIIDFDGTNGSTPNGGLINVTDEVATGVQSSSDNHFSVYPNPVADYAICTISSAGNNSVVVKVNDVSGKEILNEKLTANNSQLKIDLSELSAGTYFIEVLSGDKKQTAKIQKD